LSPLANGVKNLEIPPSRFRLDIIKFIAIYNIPERDGRVYFPEVFWPLMHSVFGSNSKTLLTNKFAKIVFKDITQRFHLLLKFNPKLTLSQLCGHQLIGSRYGIKSAHEALLEQGCMNLKFIKEKHWRKRNHVYRVLRTPIPEANKHI
jgi:hypothetical protein